MAEMLDYRGSTGALTAMWVEADLQMRSYVVPVGGKVKLPSMAKSRLAIITAGWWDCEVLAVDADSGEVTRQTFQLSSKDFVTDDPAFDPQAYRTAVPIFHDVLLTLRAATNVGEVLVIWPAEGDQPA